MTWWESWFGEEYLDLYPHRDVASARHEAACASGSVAVLAATAEIEAGRYDCALVLAVEQERNVPGADAPKHLGAAAWIGHEGQDATFMWPYMFSQLADEYDRRYGLNDAHLHAIAELNMRNAKANPLAQTRGWTFGPGGRRVCGVRPAEAGRDQAAGGGLRRLRRVRRPVLRARPPAGPRALPLRPARPGAGFFSRADRQSNERTRCCPGP